MAQAWGPAVRYDYEGRVVLVTGGVRGVGAGITRRFLAAGATVVAGARGVPAAVPKVDGRRADVVTADVRDPAEAAGLVEQVVARHGRLDVVVNNAGGAPFATADTASPRLHQRVVELNLLAPLHVAQAANRVMQEQEGGGSIIMIGSVSGVRPSPGTAAYGAAKAGLDNLARSLAVEWAPRVRVNTVTVGLVQTESADLHYGDAEGVAAVARTVPLGRMACPEDVGDVCLYLGSAGAAYVSGASLLLHGGGERPAFLDAATTNHAQSGSNA
ncbi:SDR family oxidoreductase [Pseudonocardia lutea]|uniref:SDR family oxidoreductase n=1 Tax=Pseudonocardia lutea TaxID=2172015 RepID=A0ABW1IDP5_9PSEU